MIVLDTNVLSELMRRAPDERVLAWVDAKASPAITAITVAELLYGVERLDDGARKTGLASAVRALVREEFRDRVLPFDGTAAERYGVLVAERVRQGRPINAADAQIAAICHVHGASLATRNVRDFEDTGIDVIDPWTAERSR